MKKKQIEILECITFDGIEMLVNSNQKKLQYMYYIICEFSSSLIKVYRKMNCVNQTEIGTCKLYKLK